MGFNNKFYTKDMGRLRKAYPWYSKKKLNEVIFGTDTPAGHRFDIILLIVIFISVVVAIWESTPRPNATTKLVLSIIEYAVTILFTIEYIVRIYCSPKPKEYIFSFFGIVDLLSTLPLYLSFILPGAQYFVLIRAFRLIRVFRIFRLFTFINEGIIFVQSLRKSVAKILVYLLFVLILVTIIGTIEYVIENGEPGSGFTDLPSSIYWAIVTMTTVGYGDITPVTTVGRILSALIMVLGYTIIAVPTGIVSATVINETRKRVKKGRCPRCNGKVENGFKFCPHCAEKL